MTRKTSTKERLTGQRTAPAAKSATPAPIATKTGDAVAEANRMVARYRTYVKYAAKEANHVRPENALKYQQQLDEWTAKLAQAQQAAGATPAAAPKPEKVAPAKRPVAVEPATPPAAAVAPKLAPKRTVKQLISAMGTEQGTLGVLDELFGSQPVKRSTSRGARTPRLS